VSSQDTELDPEDAKIVTLARSLRGRNRSDEGAAVRDLDGRTYVASSVSLPSLILSALQAAVVIRSASGARPRPAPLRRLLRHPTRSRDPAVQPGRFWLCRQRR
jgi:hypothetical protein